MLPGISQHLEAQRAPLKAAIVELVRVPSVCDEGEGGYPYAHAIHELIQEKRQN